MKARIFIILAVIVAFLSSCSLDGSSNYTPTYAIARPYNTNGDSLYFHPTDVSGVYRLDTISVGDTIVLRVYVTGISNNLTAFYINQSADSVSKILLPDQISMDSTFTSASDYQSGKFIMPGTNTDLYFPFKYIAIKASNEAKLVFTVVSDAQFDDSFVSSNSTTFTIKTPIIEKVEEDSTETNL
ncbi:MAG: hypothetical protein PHH37_13615 [Paludibacter sp.]|nr:hypothetical protein [Paludibacter sp.]